MPKLIVMEEGRKYLVVDAEPREDQVATGTVYEFGSQSGGVLKYQGQFRKSRGPMYDPELAPLYAAHYGTKDPTKGGSTDGPGSSSTQVDAPTEDHGTGDPITRPADEQPPPSFAPKGGSVHTPVRGGGKDSDSDGFPDEVDAKPNNPRKH